METGINNIRQNEGNPRKISKQKMSDLVNSILSFPEMLSYRSIVTDGEGVIIGGNMRHKALLSIAQMSEGETRQRLSKSVSPEEVEAKVAYWGGWRKSPNVSVESEDMDEEERTEFIIKDNGDFGEWDKKMVDSLYADVFQSYEAASVAMAGFEGVAVEAAAPTVPTVSAPAQAAQQDSDPSETLPSQGNGVGVERQGGEQPLDISEATPSSPSENGYVPDDYELPPVQEQVIERGFYETPQYCDHMQFDRFKIPVTTQEKERWMNVLDNYTEENGISYGFIKYLQNGMGIIK